MLPNYPNSNTRLQQKSESLPVIWPMQRFLSGISGPFGGHRGPFGGHRGLRGRQAPYVLRRGHPLGALLVKK